MIRFLIFTCCFFILTTNTYTEISTCTEHRCIAVVDAGSTGSRLHVFSYDLDESNTAIDIKELWSKKVKPGFATVETNQSAVNAYLTNLFTDSPIHNIPVYFYATAGMRLMSQAKQKIYYQAVQNWFNQHSEWQLVEAKTISGNDEALYDWLAVNYHLGTLKSTSNNPIGVMDIGGASVQVVFPVQKDAESHQGSYVELDLYNQHISLFVHSFLGLGQNEMTHQLLDTASCFSEGYPLPDGKTGHGDAVRCAQEISPLINQVHKVNNEVQPILATHHLTSWYAMGGIAALAESKPFHIQNNQVTSLDLLQQANNLVCQQSWDSLSSQYPNDEYIESYCILPAFYYALMVDGYGFSENQIVNFVPSAQNLDWTIGVVLHH